MKPKRRALLAAALIIAVGAGIGAAYFWLFAGTSSRFRHLVIDADTPAQRAVADINGDGRLDIFAAVDFESEKPIGLFWYEYPGWIRHTIAEGVNFRADDMESGDIDRDGDPDMVVTIDEDGKIFWYENPLPNGNPSLAVWKKHYVGVSGGYVKDVEVADLDGDGNLEILTRIHEKVSIFLSSGQDAWSKVEVKISPKEGMAVGDINGDGMRDVVLNGFWLQTPRNLETGSWRKFSIDEKWYNQSSGKWQDNCANVAIADLNRDGNNDVILSHSEKQKWPISWYESTGVGGNAWVEHVVTARFNFCETLQAADIDLDGDIDLVAGEMKKSSRYGDLSVYLNNGKAENWTSEVVAKRIGIYDGLVADIDSDGDADIIGCRDYNKPPIDWWENRTADSNHWNYHAIDQKRPKDQFGKMGLVFADVNHDGWQDIVAGSFLYLNPAGRLDAAWQRIELPRSADIYFTENIDDDDLADLVGISGSEILWIEAVGASGTAWDSKVIGTVPEGRTQGYIKAQMLPGGKPELVFTHGKNLFYLKIPEKADNTDHWDIMFVSGETEEEGVAAGDIDHDGDLDLATISSDGHQIVWLENRGADSSGQWESHHIGDSDQWSDRIAVVDVNRDGRLDVISTEETQDWQYNANIYWFEAPAEPKQPWIKHIVATLRSVNSMDTADFDGDGDIDVVAAEHTDQRSEEGAPDNLTIVYENRDNGKIWAPKLVERGSHSSHLGSKLCDLDNDGDLDIVSIAWRQYRFLHVWENVAGKFVFGAP
jgi:hypothetical protein